MSDVKVRVRTIEEGAQDAASNWTELYSKVQLGKEAFGMVTDAAQAAYGVMKEGATIKAAQAGFEQLAGGADAAAQTLDRLRSATAGTVNDFDLMSNANSLMSMGIAGSADELEKHFEIVSRLKKPTDSAADAMENWAAMMANQSIPRLDSFGISSGAVKDRIDELMSSQEGMNRETAFTQAVMEQAEQSMLRVADATQGQAADVARLEASWANLTNQGKVLVADALAPAVENAANLTSQLVEMSGAADNGKGPLVNTAIVINEINKAFGRSDPALQAWIDGHDHALTATGEAADRYRDLTGEINITNEALAKGAGIQTYNRDAVLEANRALVEAEGANRDLSGEITIANEAMAKGAGITTYHKDAVEAFAAAERDAAAAAEEAAAAQAAAAAKQSEYFQAALNSNDAIGFFNESAAEMADRSIYVSNLTGEQAGALADLRSQYDKAAGTVRDYELGVKGLGMTEEERAAKVAELQESMTQLEGAMNPLVEAGGRYVDVAGKATINEQALNQAIYDSAAAADASATDLAVLGGALGLYSDEAVNAALKSALIQLKIDELTQKYAEGRVSVESMQHQLQDYIAEINNIPDAVSTDVALTGVDAAISKAGRLADQLSALGGQVSASDAAGATERGDGAVGLSDGGVVTGGIPGRDSVPAMLMPGERVLTPEQNRRYEQGGGDGRSVTIHAPITISGNNPETIAAQVQMAINNLLGRSLRSLGVT